MTSAAGPRHPRRATAAGVLWRLLLASGLVLVVLLAVAPARAQAHAFLLFTTPVADGAVATPPAELELVFNEPVVVHEVTLRDTTGAPQPLGEPRPGGDGRVAIVPVAGALATGVYTVGWEITSADGDRHAGTFRFAVGAAVAAPGATDEGGRSVAWGQAALRWLLFGALALSLGALVGRRLVDAARKVNPAMPPVRSWLGATTLAGTLAATGLAAPLADDLVGSTAGRVAAVALAGFAAAGLLVARRRPGWAVVPLLAVVAAEAVRSHAHGAAPGWGAVIAGLHLAAAAVWVGALVHVVRAGWAWRTHRGAVWWLVSTYARTALWLAAGVLAAGVAMGLLLVPADALTTTSYGRILLVKLALVAAAVGIAAVARWLLHLRGHPARLTRIATVEASVLVAVLAASAVLTAAPPAGQQPTDPPPPPAVGVVQPIGTLAGQLGLAIAASDGQLVVRVSTPRYGDYYQPATTPAYTLAGRLDPAGSAPVTLEFRRCGDDCFVSTLDWGEGDNVLSLRAEAECWAGGSATVVVPWPVTEADNEQVSQVVAAMRQAGEFTVLESITSDTRQPMPTPEPIPVTADWFLSNEPYGSGVAPLAVVLPDQDGRLRLRLGFPGERRFAELAIDESSRITTATLAGPKHLIHRQFHYDH